VPQRFLFAQVPLGEALRQFSALGFLTANLIHGLTPRRWVHITTEVVKPSRSDGEPPELLALACGWLVLYTVPLVLPHGV